MSRFFRQTFTILGVLTNMSKKLFDGFMLKMNVLNFLNSNFEKIWLDYLDLFATCEINYLEFYITNMFQCVFFVSHEATKLVNDPLLIGINQSYERIDIEDSKIAIKNIIFEMSNKYQQLSDFLYKRHKDIANTKCIFDKNSQIIKIVASKTHKYAVLMDTSSSTSTFSFTSQTSMLDEINGLLIPLPPTAPSNYSHDSLLTTRKTQESSTDGQSENDSSSMFRSPVAKISSRVSSFNTTNKVGSRSLGKLVKRPVYMSNTDAEVDSPVKKGPFVADFNSPFLQTAISNCSSAENNTSMESSFTSVNVSTYSGSFLNTTSVSVDNNSLISAFSNALTEYGLTTPLKVNGFTDNVELEASSAGQSGKDEGLGGSGSGNVELSPITSSPKRNVELEASSAGQSGKDDGLREDSGSGVVRPFDFDNEDNNKQSGRVSELHRVDSQEEESPISTKRAPDSSETHTSKKKRTRSTRSSRFLGDPASSSDDEADTPKVIRLGAPDSDFFCADGEHESTYPSSAFKKSGSLQQQKSVTLKKGGMSDEEYCSSDDSVELRYLDKKAKARAAAAAYRDSNKRSKRDIVISSHEDASSKRGKSSPGLNTPSSQTMVRFTPLSSQVEESNTFAKAMKNCAIKKRTGEDYKSNTMEDIDVFLKNMVPCTKASASQLRDEDMTPQDLVHLNIKLDRKIVQFLVKFVTTRIGAEIGLQRCLIDYILQKQYLNSLKKAEQQEISNWQEIFLNLEELILDEIKTEYDDMYNVIVAAQQRTRSMLVMNFNIQRQRVSDDSSLSDMQKENRNQLLDDELRRLNVELSMKAEPELAAVMKRRKFAKSRVHSTLHHTCITVCVMWLECNNSLDQVDQDKLRLYYIRSNADKTTLSELKDNGIAKNGMFIMSSDLLDSVDDGARDSVSPANEHLKIEQEQLETILSGDHMDKLVHTIKSIPDDVVGIQKLIQICWSKGPRVTLKHAIAKARVGKASPSNAVQDSTIPVPSTPTATAVEGLESTSLASAAVGSHKLTSFYPLEQSSSPTSVTTGTCENDRINGDSSSGSVTFAVATPVLVATQALVGLADPKSTVSRIASSYDFVIRLITRCIQTVCGDQCLILQMKSAKRDYALERLKFLQLLVSNVAKDDAESLSVFMGSTFYDMFECNWFFRAKEIDSNNTRGDGYCFTRGKDQLKFRQDSDFKVGVQEMREFDAKNNSSASDNTNEAFVAFINDLPILTKEESGGNQSFVTQMGEMVWFKHKKQLEMMPTILSLRGPGSSLGEMFWGDLSTVTMLAFNVTCVSKLLVGEFDTVIKKDRSKWVKYEASSVPDVRSKKSFQRSRRPLVELDQVVGQELNLLYYYKPHFCVIGNPVRKVFEQDFNATKTKCVGLLMERVRLVVETVPDFGRQLGSLIKKCENIDGEVNYEDFPVTTFEQRFAKKWPDAYVADGVTIDLTDEEEEPDETKEITRLRQALILSNSKLQLSEEYNAVLRHECVVRFSN